MGKPRSKKIGRTGILTWWRMASSLFTMPGCFLRVGLPPITARSDSSIVPSATPCRRVGPSSTKWILWLYFARTVAHLQRKLAPEALADARHQLLADARFLRVHRARRRITFRCRGRAPQPY